MIQKTFPDDFETWYWFGSNEEYRGKDLGGGFLADLKKNRLLLPDDSPLLKHVSSPFVWIEKGEEKTALGGRDKFCEWIHAQDKFKGDSKVIMKIRNNVCVFDDF